MAQEGSSTEKLRAFASALVARAELMSKLGYQYDGSRNLYKALGYRTNLTFIDYYTQYERQDIAKAIIDRPVNATWQGPLELIETNDSKDTPFEKAWRDLNRELGLKTRLARADRLTGIGEYGILLLGLDDVANVEGWATPVRKGVRKLKYIKPFSQKSAPIEKYENKTTSDRYGMPLIYKIEIGDPASKATKSVNVHYSRIIHITDGNLESEVLGIPRLQAVFNRLQDLEKITGGDAEMFWRGARPGYKGKLDTDYTMTDEVKQALLDQIAEYEHDIHRFLINEGIDIDALTQQISDPKPHVDVQIQMISAQTGIPKRILTGSERGELSSSEDRGEWLSFVQSRREEHAEPRILRVFVDKLIELEALPKPKDDYTVKWADLFSVSEKARVEIGKSRANALREYTTNPIAEAVLPPKAFMRFMLGLTSDEIDLVNSIRESEMEEEVKFLGKVRDELGLEPTGGNGTDKSKDQTGEPRTKPRPSEAGPVRRTRPAV